MDSLAWLLTGLIGGVGNALFFHVVLQDAIKCRTIIRDEVDRFVRGLALGFLVPCTVLWLVQMTIAGPATYNFAEWPQPQKGVAIVVTIVVLARVVHRFFFDDGAEAFSRILVAARRPGFNEPRAVKFAVGVMVFGTVASLLAATIFGA